MAYDIRQWFLRQPKLLKYLIAIRNASWFSDVTPEGLIHAQNKRGAVL